MLLSRQHVKTAGDLFVWWLFSHTRREPVCTCFLRWEEEGNDRFHFAGVAPDCKITLLSKVELLALIRISTLARNVYRILGKAVYQRRVIGMFSTLTDEARSKQCGVLVHCLAGISRSVTVTVAYLMQRLHLSLNDAYDFVKRKKSNISPNFNFMGQLLDFERTLGLHSPCDNRSTSSTEQLFFTTPTNHNVFQLDTLEST